MWSLTSLSNCLFHWILLIAISTSYLGCLSLGTINNPAHASSDKRNGFFWPNAGYSQVTTKHPLHEEWISITWRDGKGDWTSQSVLLLPWVVFFIIHIQLQTFWLRRCSAVPQWNLGWIWHREQGSHCWKGFISSLCEGSGLLTIISVTHLRFYSQALHIHPPGFILLQILGAVSWE